MAAFLEKVNRHRSTTFLVGNYKLDQCGCETSNNVFFFFFFFIPPKTAPNTSIRMPYSTRKHTLPTIPQVETIQANQRRKMLTLRAAGQARARSMQTTTLDRAYCGGNPIAHNFSPGIVPQTLLYEQQRRNIVFDPQKPLKEQLLARWKEVECLLAE